MEKFYNLRYLEELAAGDNEFMMSMIYDFVTQTPETLNQIALSIDNSDYKNIYSIVHRFIPTLEYIGVSFIVRKFRDIEQLAKSEAEISTIKEIFNQASKETSIIIETLKKDFLINTSNP